MLRLNFYNPKQLWKVINQVIGKINNKTSCIGYIKVDNTEYYQPKDISNHLGKYFANTGQTFAEKTPPPFKSILEYIDKISRNNKTLFLNLAYEQEIKQIIGQLSNKNSSRHDDIINILLKKIKHTIIKPLNYIFNLSINSGEFPNLMKIAEIMPLYKSKARNSLTNHRPIPLLLTISKLLEKIIYERLYSFLEKAQYYVTANTDSERAIHAN